MNGYSTLHYARSLSEQRAAETSERAKLARLMAVAGVDHPVRRRFAHVLINAGVKLAPQPLHVHTTQPGIRPS